MQFERKTNKLDRFFIKTSSDIAKEDQNHVIIVHLKLICR